eukprot:Blabericola_migrator_1__9689@NODE_52_length_16271_cov_146_860775_g48_i0_p1_GENE_NODE_52_length_16271_cov_146_860775_g48_i0NODE_52_length_16271_cov_146_860775_g48_i0_p1_ORF_typecomplete_len3312_score546_95C2/PF00168_30/7_3e16C2/PF00168_30/0_75MORN/PF02493_20/3_1e02MORN/PF02493_20/38MORN/PF02493_20/0_12MORN/PF02493_20/0_29MORN/PF02493_20/15MORN/PF02493_20/44MORN/PF02493_20/3_7e02MORN/PF02493_20/1_9MORN/PF02493_20/0_00039MORN/PF02493_20/0_71PipA/PF07108_11/1_4PipA/PF07108_11/1_1e03_NODE_52_length_1
MTSGGGLSPLVANSWLSPRKLLRQTLVTTFLLSSSSSSYASAVGLDSLFDAVPGDEAGLALSPFPSNLEAALIRPNIQKLPPNATYHGVEGVFIPIIKTTPKPTTTTTTTVTTTTTTTTTTPKPTKVAKTIPTTTTTLPTTTTTGIILEDRTTTVKTTTQTTTTAQAKVGFLGRLFGAKEQPTTTTVAPTLKSTLTTTGIALDTTVTAPHKGAPVVPIVKQKGDKEVKTTPAPKQTVASTTGVTLVTTTSTTKQQGGKQLAGAAGPALVQNKTKNSTSTTTTTTMLPETTTQTDAGTTTFVAHKHSISPIDLKTAMKSVSLIFSNLPVQEKASLPQLSQVVNGSLPVRMYKDEPCVVGAYSRTNRDIYLDLNNKPTDQAGAVAHESFVSVVPRGEVGSVQNMSLFMTNVDHSSMVPVNISAQLVQSSNPKLRMVTVKPGRLDPQFSPNVFGYHVRIPEKTHSVKMKFETVNDREAQCTMDGETWHVAKGHVSIKVPQAANDTRTFRMKCVGADKTDSATYVFNLVPQLGGDTTLSSLGVLGAPLMTSFDPLYSGPYVADLLRGASNDGGPEIEYTQIRATPSNPRAVVTVDGVELNAANNFTSPFIRVPRGEKRSIPISVRTPENAVAETYSVILTRGGSNLPAYETTAGRQNIGAQMGLISTIVSAVTGRHALQNNQMLQMASTYGHQQDVSEAYDNYAEGIHIYNAQPTFGRRVQAIPANTSRLQYVTSRNYPHGYDGNPVASYRFFLSSDARLIDAEELFGGFYDTNLADYEDLVDTLYNFDSVSQTWRAEEGAEPVYVVDDADIQLSRRLIALSAADRQNIINELESHRKASENLEYYTSTVIIVTGILSAITAVYMCVFFAYLQEPRGGVINVASHASQVDPQSETLLSGSHHEAQSANQGDHKQGGLRLRQDYPAVLHPVRFFSLVLDIAFCAYVQGAVGILMTPASEYAAVSVGGVRLSLTLLKILATITLLCCFGYVIGGAAMLSRLESHMTFSQQFCEYHDTNMTHAKALYTPKIARYLPIIGRLLTIEVNSVAPLKSCNDPSSQAVVFESAQNSNAENSGYAPVEDSSSSSDDDDVEAGGPSTSRRRRRPMDPTYVHKQDAVKVAMNDFVYNHQVTNYDNRNAALLARYPSAKLGETSFQLRNAYGYPLTLQSSLHLEHLTAFMQLIDDFSFLVPRENCQFSAKDAWYHLICHAKRGLFYDWAINRTMLLITLALATAFSKPSSAVPLIILTTYCFLAALVRIPSHISSAQAEHERDMVMFEAELKAAKLTQKELHTAEQVWPFSEPGFIERFHSVRERKERGPCGMGSSREDAARGPADKGVCRSRAYYIARSILLGLVTADLLLGCLGVVLLLSRRSSAAPLIRSPLIPAVVLCVCLVLLNMEALSILFQQITHVCEELFETITAISVSSMDLLVNNGSLGERLSYLFSQVTKCVTGNPTANFHYPRAGIAVRRFPVEEVILVSNELGLQLPAKVVGSTPYLESTVPNKNRLKMHKTLVIHGGIGASRVENLRSLPVQVPFHQLLGDVGEALQLNTEGTIDRLVATIQIVNHTIRANAAGLAALKTPTHDSYLSLYASEEFFPSPGKIKLRRNGHTYSIRYDPENNQLVVRGPAIVHGRKYYLRTAAEQPSRREMYQNAHKPLESISDDSSLPSVSPGTATCRAVCESPGSLRVDIANNQPPDLYKDINIETPTGAHYVVDPNQIKVHYDKDCGEMLLRYQELSMHPQPYIVTYSVRPPHDLPVDAEGTAVSNGCVYFPLIHDDCPVFDTWLTMRDENGAVIDIDPKQTDAYQFFFPEKAPASTVGAMCNILVGRGKAVWSFLRGRDTGAGVTEEPIPCTVVQCVNPIDRVYRVDPNFVEAYRVRNARVHELRARQAATENSEALPSLCESLMTPSEYVQFWKSQGVHVVDEAGQMHDPLVVDQETPAFQDKYKQIAVGEAQLRQLIYDRLESRIQETLEQMEKVRVWIRAYNDPELHTTQLERDLADWSMRPDDEISAKLASLKAQKAAYEKQASNFVYPCNIPDVFISKRPNLSAQFRVWSDIIQSWLLFEEGADTSTPEAKSRVSSVIRSVLQAIKSTIYSNEMKSLNAYRSILHYVIGSQSVRGMSTRWKPDSFRAHTALVRIWPEKPAADGSEATEADFTKHPEWLPCLLRLTPNTVQMLLPNRDDLGRAADGDYPWQRCTGLYVPIHAFQKFELVQDAPTDSGNPLLKSMTTRLICRKNQMGYVDDEYARRMEDDQLGNDVCLTDFTYQRRMRYKMMLGHCVLPSQMVNYPDHEVDYSIEAPEKNVYPLTFKMNPAFAAQWERAIKMARLFESHDVYFDGRRVPVPRPQPTEPVPTTPPHSDTESSSPVSEVEQPIKQPSMSIPSSSEEVPVDTSDYRTMFEGGIHDLKYHGSVVVRNDDGTVYYQGGMADGQRSGQGFTLLPKTSNGVVWRQQGNYDGDEVSGHVSLIVENANELSNLHSSQPPRAVRHTLLRVSGVVKPSRDRVPDLSDVPPPLRGLLKNLFESDTPVATLSAAEISKAAGLADNDAAVLRRALPALLRTRVRGDVVTLGIQPSGTTDLRPECRGVDNVVTSLLYTYLPHKTRWLSRDLDRDEASCLKRLDPATTVFQYADGTAYAGAVVAGVPHGRGKMYNAPARLRYNGEFEAGRPHGYGVLELGPDDAVADYYGTFQDGKRHGEGLQVVRGGAARVKAVWRNDMVDNGPITIQIAPEIAKETGLPITLFKGTIVDGLPDGDVHVRFVNGCTYEGGVKEGKKNGFGTIKRDGKVVYSGGFKNDYPHGRCAEYVLSDKKVYRGTLDKGLRSGMGELYEPNGSDGRPGKIIYEGLWSVDVPHGRGQYYAKDGEYDGEFKHGRRHGKGRFVYKEHPLANGKNRVYEGGFWDDQPHGIGKYLSEGGAENVYRVNQGVIVDASKSSYKPFCGSAPDIKQQPQVEKADFKAEPKNKQGVAQVFADTALFDVGAFLDRAVGENWTYDHVMRDYKYLPPHNVVELLEVRNPNPPSDDDAVSPPRPTPGATPNTRPSPPSAARSVVKLFVVEGRNMKDQDTIGSMDPYVIVSYGASKKKTKPIKSGGSNCKFNKTLMFPEERGIDKLKVEVWDSDRIGKDDLVGVGEVSMAKALRTGEDLSQIVTLMFEKKGKAEKRGELVINLFLTKVNPDYRLHSQSSQKSVASEECVKAPHTKVTVHTCTEIRSSKGASARPFIRVHHGHVSSSTATGSGINVAYDEVLCLPYNGAQTLDFELLDQQPNAKTPELLGTGSVNIQSNPNYSGEVQIREAKNNNLVGILDISLTVNK